MLIDEINTEIRQSFFNVILLMKASPIQLYGDSYDVPRSLTSQLSGDSETTISQHHRTTFPSFFRTDLLQSLSETKKAFNLKFEILKRANLMDITKFGCRIMFIQSEMASLDGVVVESDECKPEVVKFSEFREILPRTFQPGSQNLDTSVLSDISQNPQYFRKASAGIDKMIELFIVGTKNDMATADFLVNEVKIPHVVAFNFKRDPSDRIQTTEPYFSVDPPSFKRKLYEDECVEKFCGYFFNELIDGCSVKQAFEHAKKEMIECISFSFFDSKDDLVTEFLGEGPVLLPKYDQRGNEVSHDDFLFGVDEYVLQGGKVEEISSVRFPTNVHKSLIPFTGRVREMEETMRKLLKPKDNILLITGEPGVGKTRFILEVAYSMLVRNFFADGIFYFPLRRLKKKNIFEMIKETINSEAFGSKMEYNLKNLFRNKKMLLIFDDIDIFFDSDIEFPWLVFSILQKSHIPTVLIQKDSSVQRFSGISTMDRMLMLDRKQSKKSLETSDLRNKINDDLVKERLKLERFTDLEIAHILVSLIEQNYKFDMTPSEAVMQPYIKAAKGNPSKVIKLLNEGKIYWKGHQLQLNRVYSDFLSKKSGIRVRTGRIPHWRGGEDDPSGGLILTFSRHCSQYHSTIKATKKSAEPSIIISSVIGDVTLRVPFPLDTQPQVVQELESEYDQASPIKPLAIKRSNIRTRTQEAFELKRAFANVSSRESIEEEKSQQETGRNQTEKLKIIKSKNFESESSDEEEEENRRKERYLLSRRHLPLRGLKNSMLRSHIVETAGEETDIGGPNQEGGFPSKLSLMMQRQKLKVKTSLESKLDDLQQGIMDHESGGFSVNDEETQSSESSSSESESNEISRHEKIEGRLPSTPFLRSIKSRDVKTSPMIQGKAKFKGGYADLVGAIPAKIVSTASKHSKTLSMMDSAIPLNVVPTATTTSVLVNTPKNRTPKITHNKTTDLQSQLLGLVKTPSQKTIFSTGSGAFTHQTPSANAILINISQARRKSHAHMPSNTSQKSPIIKPIQTQNRRKMVSFTPKVSPSKTDRPETVNEEISKKVLQSERLEEKKPSPSSVAGLTLRKIDRK